MLTYGTVISMCIVRGKYHCSQIYEIRGPPITWEILSSPQPLADPGHAHLSPMGPDSFVFMYVFAKKYLQRTLVPPVKTSQKRDDHHTEPQVSQVIGPPSDKFLDPPLMNVLKHFIEKLSATKVVTTNISVNINIL